MAKKKQELTSEELLAEALVREEDWPYRVPGNWVWTRLGSVADKISDGTHNPPPNSLKGIPLLSAKNIFDYTIDFESTNRWITEEQWERENKRTDIKKDDVLLTIVGSIGRTAVVSDSKFALQRSVAVISSKIAMSKYISYYLSSPYMSSFLNENAKGTAQKGFYLAALNAISFPLPPLAEQQRIINRIESLFDKLNQAKDLVQEALDSFETRKAVILHQAFTGKLTKSRSYEKTNILNNMEKVKNNLIARKVIQRPKKIEPILENDKEAVNPKLWEIVKLGEISFVTKLAGFEYTKHIHLEESGEIPVIRAQNVRSGYLDLRNLLYINSETSGLLNRSALYKKCLVITFIGAGIGDISIFDSDKRYHLAPNVAKIELYNPDEKEYVLSEFILYYLLSPLGQKQIFKNMKATAQPSLSMATIRDIIIPLPSIEEQQEIVRILDVLFEKEQNAKELCDLIDQIEAMKKAILGKAFRGELGTNETGEESVVTLLKSILK